jgi:hypothetical protein
MNGNRWDIQASVDLEDSKSSADARKVRGYFANDGAE